MYNDVEYISKDFEYVFVKINKLEKKISKFIENNKKDLLIDTNYSFNYKTNEWKGLLQVK